MLQKIVPKRCFSWGNSMTIEFGNFTNFIVRNFVVIWEAPNKEDLQNHISATPHSLNPISSLRLLGSPGSVCPTNHAPVVVGPAAALAAEVVPPLLLIILFLSRAAGPI